MNKKIAFALSVCLMVVLVLAGCSRNTLTPSPSPSNTPMTSPLSSISPAVTPTGSPSDVSPSTSTDTPLVSAAPTEGSNDTDLELAKRVEGEVDKLSEVKKSTAIVNGNTAMIAIEYDDQYKGEMTDRIREMVEEKAKIVDAALTDIYVTDDAAMMEEIKDMRERVDGGSVFEDIKAEFDKLVQRIRPTA